MYCPKCRQKTKVIDSRDMTNSNGIYRRRKCVNAKCGHRFKTYEEYESSQDKADLKELKDKLKHAKSAITMAQEILEGGE